MKKNLLLLFAVLFYGLSHAQSISTQNFIGDGEDDGTVLLTINSSDITVNLGQPITQIKFVNAIMDYWGWECGDYYGFTLMKDGVAVITDGCDADFEDFDVTGFTTLEIIANDLDDYVGDWVEFEFDLEVTYQTPSCLMPINITASNMTVNSLDLTWTAGGSETLWNIEYGAPGFTSGAGTLMNGVSTFPVTISGLTINTDYEFRIVSDCGAGDLSTAAIFNTRLGYCLPTIASSSYYLNSITTTGALTNLSNTNSGFSTNGYGDFTSLSFSAYSGQVITFVGTHNNTSNTFGTAIWIDWNNDYVFDATEKIFTTTAYSNGFNSGNYTIPLTTANGSYRVRILTNYNNSTPNNACTSFSNGEIEDYTLSIVSAPSCVQVLNLTTLNATSNSIDLSWTVAGIETLWNIEYGVVGFATGSGTLISGVTALPVTIPGLVANTNYEFRVQADCGAGDLSGWTSTSMFFGYCTPTYNNSSDYITAFNTNGAIQNVNYSASSYSAYVDNTGIFISGYPSQTFNFSSSYEGGSNTIKIWIDWNNNLTFEASEVVYSTYSNNEIQSGTITIPTSTALGNYRMRVMSRYSDNTTTSACGNFTFGNVIDYTLSVITAPTCLPITTPIISSQNSNSATYSWTAGGTETSWNVEYGLKGFTPGTGTTVVVNNPSVTLSNLTASTDYDVFITADCGAGDLSYVNGPNSFKTYLECGGMFTDNGGVTGNYSADTTITWKICASSPDQLVKVEFTSFQLEPDDGFYYYDNLEIYKGNTLLSTHWGIYSPGTILSDLGGCLTFVLATDDTDEFPGWVANVSCLNCTPTSGIDGSETVCSLDNTLDLNTVIQSTEEGEWKLDILNALITNNGDLNVGVLAPGVYNPYYVTGISGVAGCSTDTVRATITVVGPSNSGTAGSFEVCNSGTFYLPNGLTGTADAGGTWYDSSNQALIGNSVTYNNQIPGNYNYTYTVSNGVCPPSSTTIDVYVEQCASVEELDKMNFNLYPNPTTDNIFIQYDGITTKVDMIIVDTKGAILMTQNFIFEQNSNHQVDLNELKSGVYYIQLVTESGSTTFTIVKK